MYKYPGYYQVADVSWFSVCICQQAGFTDYKLEYTIWSKPAETRILMCVNRFWWSSICLSLNLHAATFSLDLNPVKHTWLRLQGKPAEHPFTLEDITTGCSWSCFSCKNALETRECGHVTVRKSMHFTVISIITAAMYRLYISWDRNSFLVSSYGR